MFILGLGGIRVESPSGRSAALNVLHARSASEAVSVPRARLPFACPSLLSVRLSVRRDCCDCVATAAATRPYDPRRRLHLLSSHLILDSAERALKYMLVGACRCVRVVGLSRDINGISALKPVVDACMKLQYLLRWRCDGGEWDVWIRDNEEGAAAIDRARHRAT